MLSTRSASWRSIDACISSAVLEAPSVSSPRRVVVSMRPPRSTTVTPSAARPSTLAATRCTMPSTCAAERARPGASFTTTDADGRRSSPTNSERSGSARWTRTISRLGGVESARVHLALPERSLFVGEDRRPSASVVVKLAPGRALSAAQIDGIVHLVAASVEGLAADGVTVVDAGGRMLTTDRRGGETVGASSTALEMQASIERRLAERVESMLAAVVDRDKAVARVAATLEVARVERTEETYDPERTALRTQRTTREQTTGARTGGGAPGVQSNLTNDPAATTEPKGRRDESQSYEVSKVVSHTVAPAGVVKQLSVAVLIDGTYTGAGAARKFTPRPAEELERLKELVKNAVGFSEPRGDRIELTSVPFQTEPWTSGESVLAALGTWLPALLMRLLAVGLVAAGLFYVVRPLVLGLAARGGEGRTALPEATAAQLTQENLALTQQNPERAAQLVREWLREGAPAVEG